MTHAGVAPPENMYQMTHIVFSGLIKSNKSERFVFRFFFSDTVMKLNKLVVRHPLAADGAFNGAAVAHLAGNTPVSDEIIEKRIRERSRRGSSKQNGRDEQKQDHCRSRASKHGKLDSLMVFHFRPAINAFRSRDSFFDLRRTGVKLQGHAESWVECLVDCLSRYLSL